MNSVGKGWLRFKLNGLVRAGGAVRGGGFKRGGFGGAEDVRGGGEGSGRICSGMVCGSLGVQQEKTPPACAAEDRQSSDALKAMIHVDDFIKKFLS